MNKQRLKPFGLLLIAGGLAIIGFVYIPILKQEADYRFKTKERWQDEEEVKPASKEFGLVISKIGVNARVFEEVDAQNPNEYLPLLKKGVAHAKGSVLPGEKGFVFIFAHSADSPLNITQYNAIFYLLNKLEPTDEILIYYRKEKYYYSVAESVIVPPEVLADYIYNLSDNVLVLQTCHPPGTTINRLLVIAKELE